MSPRPLAATLTSHLPGPASGTGKIDLGVTHSLAGRLTPTHTHTGVPPRND